VLDVKVALAHQPLGPFGQAVAGQDLPEAGDRSRGQDGKKKTTHDFPPQELGDSTVAGAQ
jgi:hypothetical protein